MNYSSGGVVVPMGMNKKIRGISCKSTGKFSNLVIMINLGEGRRTLPYLSDPILSRSLQNQSKDLDNYKEVDKAY